MRGAARRLAGPLRRLLARSQPSLDGATERRGARIAGSVSRDESGARRGARVGCAGREGARGRAGVHDGSADGRRAPGASRLAVGVVARRDVRGAAVVLRAELGLGADEASVAVVVRLQRVAAVAFVALVA